jgi:hypothetical protein
VYKLIWCIKSRKTNKFTNLILVNTENTDTVDFLLTHGLVLYGKHHQCEPSKPPTPTPLQCTKCFQLGHHVTACPNKPACPKCPQTHAPNKCEGAISTCLLCGGPHAAWSRSCPSIKTAPITEEGQRPQEARPRKFYRNRPNENRSNHGNSHTPSIKIKNFTSYIRVSTVNRSRGVVLLVASNITNTKHELPPHLSDLEAVAADIQFNNSTITLISYYNPPKEPLST